MRRPLILLVAIAVPLAAQWLDYRDPRTPRKNGKPDLSAPAPRTGGKPDLSGVWRAARTPIAIGSDVRTLQIDVDDIGMYAANVFQGLKPDQEPLRPEAAAILKRRASLLGPTTLCLPAGIPIGLLVYEFKIIQTPREVLMLPGFGDPPRQIYFDGRRLPANPQPTWSGTSVAKWQGDTLIVESTGFTEDSWLDGQGHPRSATMHITESYRRRDFGHMDLEVSIDDPKYYTRPFGFKTQLSLIADSDVIEYVCGENEKDRAHLPKP